MDIQNHSTKDRIKEIEKLIRRNDKARFQLSKKLEGKKLNQDRLIWELKYKYLWNGNCFRERMYSCMKEVDTLQQCLHELSKKIGRGRPIATSTCSPPRCLGITEYTLLEQWLKEFHQLKNPSQRRDTDSCSLGKMPFCSMKSLHYHMQHGSMSLAEETKLLRKMKQNEDELDKITVDAAEKAYMPQSLASKRDIRARIELLCNEINQLKKKDQEFIANMKNLFRKLEASEREIDCLQKELADLNQEKNEAYECIQQLKTHGDENTCYRRYISQITNGKKSLEKNGRSLKELSDTEVEKLISLWKYKLSFWW